MSIASEISRLQTAKQNIKTSIEGKGVTVPSNATLSDYPTLIDSIEGGGGYDGIIKSMSEEEIGTPSSKAFEIKEYITAVTVPNTFTAITTSGIDLCSNLKSVVLPNSIKRIENYGLARCRSITSITIPNECNYIGQYAFSGDTSLPNIVLPSSITQIANNTFYNCTSLNNLVIPSGVTSLGGNVFQNCSSLKSLTFESETPPTINNSTFNGTPSDMIIYVPCDSVNTYKTATYWALYSSRIQAIPNSCPNHKVSFWDANGNRITGITDDDSGTITFSEVDAIRSSLSNVASIVISDSVTSLTSGCFDIMENGVPVMSALTKVEIPTTITNIPIIFNSMQSNYSYFTESQVGITVSSITSTNVNIIVSTHNYENWDDTAFSYQYYLNNGYNLIVEPSMVTLYNANDEVLGYLDDDGTGVVSKDKLIDLADLYRNDTTKVVFSNNVTEIGYEAFRGWSGLTTVQHSNNLRTLGGRAFQECKNLQTLVIPDTVTTIGNSIFVHCEVATTCYIGTGITALGADTFCDAWSLQNVVVPSNVTDIGGSGGGTFARCSGMTSIEIMGQVINIGQNGFLDDRNLRTITIHSIQPPTVVYSTLANLNNLQHIYVPCKAVDAYKAASGWSAYASRIQEIPNSCQPKVRLTLTDGTTVEKECDGNTGLTISEITGLTANKADITEAKIGNCVKTIGASTFQNCSGLTSVTIPDSVTEIGDNAFNDCSGLTSITIPDSVTSIGMNAFYNCSKLTSFTIPDSITSIETQVFYLCSGLTSITIPDSVTSIGSSAFQSCKNLSSVTIGTGVTSIGNESFGFCSQLQSLTINAITPPTLGSSVFFQTHSTMNIYVPSESVDAYKAASGWSRYANKIQAIPTE